MWNQNWPYRSKCLHNSSVFFKESKMFFFFILGGGGTCKWIILWKQNGFWTAFHVDFISFFWMCLYLRMFVFHIGLLSFSSGILSHYTFGSRAQQSCNFSWIDPRLLHSFSKCLLMLHLWVDIWIYGHSSDWPLITVTVLFNSLTVNKRSNSGDARVI